MFLGPGTPGKSPCAAPPGSRQVGTSGLPLTTSQTATETGTLVEGQDLRTREDVTARRWQIIRIRLVSRIPITMCFEKMPLTYKVIV